MFFDKFKQICDTQKKFKLHLVLNLFLHFHIKFNIYFQKC